MNEELVRNRTELTRLIYELGEFTEDSLKNAYYERLAPRSERAIDGGQTLRSLLKELAQLGVLASEFGTYRVAYKSAGL